MHTDPDNPAPPTRSAPKAFLGGAGVGALGGLIGLGGAPFLLTLLLFIGHKLEERHLEFFPALSQITGIPAPPSGTLLGTLLYIFAGAWLLVPWLVERRLPFGYYLASTFFFAMGITELAHFVFPFFTGENYGYFPGMASVFFLAPAAWWGLWKMYR